MIDASVDGFFNFINKRHRVYVKKEAGKPWPWTKDAILQQYRFTNVYRDLDAVSVDLKRNVLDGYKPWRKDYAAELVAEIIKYRLFNWPATYQLLRPLRGCWDEERAKTILRKAQRHGDKIFTGAYIVSNDASTRPKIDIVCEAVTAAHKLAPKLVRLIRANRTIENATAVIAEHVPLCGPFVSYEIVSDLRWTPLLQNAPDIFGWANPGPGATRGLNRIHRRPLKAKPAPSQLVREMRSLVKESRHLDRLGSHMRPLEARDVEHSLCELDKYLRVMNGEGKPRSRYWPTAKHSRHH
jgi:hypothetical protein